MKIKRRFFAGDEWLYFKIYSGPQKAESLLTGQLAEITEQLFSDGKISKFFFLRYVDDAYHIRIRFLVTHPSYVYDIICAIHQQLKLLVEKRILSKICIDTYNREIERYGEHTIEELETLFSFHSRDCLKILRNKTENDTQRWIASIHYFDYILSQFGLSQLEKSDFCEKSYRRTLGNTPNKATIIALDKKYRDISKQILTFEANDPDLGPEFFPDEEQRTSTVKTILAKVEKYGEVELFDLLNSITHMSFNRFFRTKQTNNELVIYYLMAKHYKSLYARAKYAGQSKSVISMS